MITKTLIGLSAVVSAGCIVGTDASRPIDAPARFAERFPGVEQLAWQPAEPKQVAVLPAGVDPARPAAPAASPLPKTDMQALARATGCQGQAWPYAASGCLTSIDGSPVRRPVRTITIERRFQNGSILVQAEVADMVTR